jgi:hypothetical protein
MIRSTLLLAAALLLAAPPAKAQLDIPFAPLADTSLKDPDNPRKTFRIDLSKVERDFPLSRADLMKITPDALKRLSQEQIDQIYGRLTAGPIPNGPFSGDLFFARGDGDGDDDRRLRARLEEILGGVEGRLAGLKINIAERLGRRLWKGKLFDRDKRVLWNFIDDLAPLRSLIDDPGSVMTATVPRDGLFGRIFPRERVWLLFPAKLYCGQSLLDGRREAVIIDYLYNDEIPGYRRSPDSVAGRGGLKIRDEIRMIRPGFYLGRAYANRMFLLNFTLYDETTDKTNAAAFQAGARIAEDCWPGEQLRRADVR